MDDFLNNVEKLAAAVRRRPLPPVDVQSIMHSVRAAEPEPLLLPADSCEPGFLAILPAAAVASAAIVIYAAFAWMDIHNPFLAMDTFVNPMGWLQ